MVEFLVRNSVIAPMVLLFFAFSILVIINIVETYKIYNSLKHIHKMCRKVWMRKQLKLVNATSNVLLYSSALISLLIHNLMPIGVAVTIGIIINCIVYSNYMKQLRIMPKRY